MADNADYWDNRWREAVSHFSHGGTKTEQSVDYWKERAASFDRMTKTSPPNRALLETVLKTVDKDTTVIDIGAGTGAWTIPLARASYLVTVVDPSAAMMDILRQNLKQEGVTNVQIVQSRWEDANVANHDISLCSHAMYGSPDLRAFVKKINDKTLRHAYMVLRLKSRDGILADLWQKYHGEPKPEEPNFRIAYNILYEMGIYADAQIEKEPRNRTDQSIDDAVDFVRSVLDLEFKPGLAAELRNYLETALPYSLGAYHWPDKSQAALVSWTPPGRAYHKI